MQQMGNGMDFMQMMQSQIITMTSLKDGNMSNAIYGIILLTLFNNIIKVLPKFYEWLSNIIKSYVKTKTNEYTEHINKTLKIGDVNKKRKGTILYEKTETANVDTILLALIKHISNLKNSEFVLFNKEYFVVNKQEFLLAPEIYCRVIEYTYDDKGVINKYSFEIYSYEYNIEKLKDFTDRIVFDYKQDCENNLGKQPYYFNEINISIPKDMNGSYRYEAANKSLIFDMTPFYTNKSLSNVFGTHLDIVKKRVDMFINNPMWYQRKGIPHTLGILLSGPPGTGKTSAIKAIANDTARHIFNINLSKMTTQTQLKNLFYSTEVKILRNGQNELINIPINKRIYVIEDIDALGDIVLDRKKKFKLNDNDEYTYDTSNVNTSSNNASSTSASSNNNSNVNASQNMSTNNSMDMMFNNMNSNTYGASLDSAFSLMGGTSMSNFSDPNLMVDSNTNTNNSMNYEYSNTRSSRSSNTDYMVQDTPQRQPSQVNSNSDASSKTKKKENNNKNPEEITLSFLLNLLDGVLETPGRIVIMTSNHPEMLDPALVRPGRIDINLRVGYCSRDMVIDMFKFFYENDDICIPDDKWSYDKELTPAELSSILQNNFDNCSDAITELITKTTHN